MVCWLVQQQEIRRMQQHASQRVTIALATGKNADGLENIIFRKQEAAKQAAQLRLRGARRSFKQVVEHARVGIKSLVLVLCEVIDIRIVAEPQLAISRLLRA